MSLSTSPILAAAASNDVAATRWLVEHERVHVDQMGDWFAPDVVPATPATRSLSGATRSAPLERKRRTPLMVAATHGSVDALAYLLSAGADPNLRGDDDERTTALHCAASGGAAMSVDCVAALLRFGAEGKALDGFGREPADVLPVETTAPVKTTAAKPTSLGGLSLRGGGGVPRSRAPFARGSVSASSSGSAGSSPPSGEDGAFERRGGRGSSEGSSGGSNGGSRQSPASLSGSGSAGSFGFAFGEPNPPGGVAAGGRGAPTGAPGYASRGDGDGDGNGAGGVPSDHNPSLAGDPSRLARSRSLDLGHRHGPAPSPIGASPQSTHSSRSAGSAGDVDVETRMSDDFRMFEFKVRRCSRTRAHDWTECPYAHPGEKARRRDPRRFSYGGAACPEFRKGSCPRGDACEYAHGVFECWLHPSRYRTQLCKDGARCGRRACFFAHAPSQLRPPTDAFGNVISSATRHANGSMPAASTRTNETTNGNGNGNGAVSLLGGRASLDLSAAANAETLSARTLISRGASLDLDRATVPLFAFGARGQSGSTHANANASSRMHVSGGSSTPASRDSTGSTGTNHGSISRDGSSFAGSGSGSGSGSERGSGSDDGRSSFGASGDAIRHTNGASGANGAFVSSAREHELRSFSRSGAQHPPPFGFGAAPPGDAYEASPEFRNASREFSTNYSYGNGISRENGGGGPAVAAVALLGGGGGALGGLHAVNGLDPESGVALPSRRSFDGTRERASERERRAARGDFGQQKLLLGGMSNLGLRGRHSVDGAQPDLGRAGLDPRNPFGWGSNRDVAGESLREPADLSEHRSNEDAEGASPPPSREAMSALLRGGLGAPAPAAAGERRPGDATVPGSKPGRGDKQTPDAPGAPPRIGPRKSSFQHLGMIEGVLGDETFLGA